MRLHLAIIGGGMVGAALAISLKNTEWQVILIDAALNVAEDARLIALNESSIGLFKRIGCWASLKSYATPIEQIHVSHRGHFGITRMDCKEFNVPALGYVVPAKYINQVLSTALTEANHIQLMRPAKLESLTQNNDGVLLKIMQNGSIQNVSVNKVVGADGSFSTVRDLLGFVVEKIDYQQSALVTRTVLQRDHKNIAYERFLKEGAIAMLPLSSEEAATIWTASNETIHYLMTLTDDAFLKELQSHFGYRLGRFLKIKNRSVYPLHMLCVKQPTKQNVILIGNAAHTLHPIAAQSLNLALSEVGYLAKYFQDPLEKKCLADVAKDFSRLNFSKKLSHHLTWIFSSDYFMLNRARQIGMIGLDVLPLIKKQFALRAMGKA